MGNVEMAIERMTTTQAADDFYSAIPRLIKVTGRAVISFALWQGTNRALLAEGGSDDIRGLAAGYCGDNAHMCVIRLYALLDSNPRRVSFKKIHRHLQRSDVVTEIVKQAASPAVWRDEATPAIHAFCKAFAETLDDDLKRRLIHFRNAGVAHLSEEITMRVTYNELKHLAHSVARMSETLNVFAPDTPLLIWEAEIDNWTERAHRTWRTALGLDGTPVVTGRP